MQKVFVTSDHHFWHLNIIKFQDRPFSNTHEMNEGMIDAWNSVVTDDDVIIHLGDFFFNKRGNFEQRKTIFDRLKGKKYLVRGNHDKRGNEHYKNLGFVFVGDYMVRGKVMFNHYYSRQDPKYPHHGVDACARRVKEYGSKLVLHGHRHNPNPSDWKENHFNVCVDQHGFKPINLHEMLEENNWQHLLNGENNSEKL